MEKGRPGTWSVIVLDGAGEEMRHRPADCKESALRQARELMRRTVCVQRIEGPSGERISQASIDVWRKGNPSA